MGGALWEGLCGCGLDEQILRKTFACGEFRTQRTVLGVGQNSLSLRINLFYDGTHCLSLEVYEQDDTREITTRLLTLAPCLTTSHEVR